MSIFTCIYPHTCICIYIYIDTNTHIHIDICEIHKYKRAQSVTSRAAWLEIESLPVNRAPHISAEPHNLTLARVSVAAAPSATFALSASDAGVYVCVRVCICTYVCMSVCVYTYTYVCICICPRWLLPPRRTLLFRPWMLVYVCVCVYVCMYVCMYVRMSVCVYACMCICICICIYVCICIYPRLLLPLWRPLLFRPRMLVFDALESTCMYVYVYVYICVFV